MCAYNPKEIDAYNVRMATTTSRMNVSTYFKETGRLFFAPKEPTAAAEYLEFMDYMSTINETMFDICVDQDAFYKYNVIKANDNIEDLLLEYKEGIDYKIVDGRYITKPCVFKMCLLQSFYSRKYSNYYLQIEAVYWYYNKYEKIYMNNLLGYKVE
jgi:hypothetical protein